VALARTRRTGRRHLDRSALVRELAAVSSMYGKCSVGDALSGIVGTTQVLLKCDRAAVDRIVHADDDGRLDRTRFVQPRDTPCVP